jgi:hypothetical protein
MLLQALQDVKEIGGASGRKLPDLKAGSNDVSRLAPEEVRPLPPPVDQGRGVVVRISGFGFDSSFGFRHSDFVAGIVSPLWLRLSIAPRFQPGIVVYSLTSPGVILQLYEPRFSVSRSERFKRSKT